MPIPAGPSVSPDMLATVEDLASITERDDLVNYQAEMLIQCATAVVQAICGQRIAEVVDDVVTLDLDQFDADTYLYLPERPVTAVSAVSIGSTLLATPVDYTVQLSRGRLWRPYGWRSVLVRYFDQPSTVTATYTHGWPYDSQKIQFARSAVLSLAKGCVSNPKGATRITIDDYTEAYDVMTSQMEATPFLITALKRTYAMPPRSARLLKSGTDHAWRR